MLSILFYPSVGFGYGIGNLFRCITLSKLLQESSEVFFLLPDDFIVDCKHSKSCLKCVSSAEIDSRKYHFDALVFDHQGPIDAEPKLKQFRNIWPNLFIVALDYFYLHDNNVDAFINLTDYRETKMSSASQASYYSGLEYAIIRPVYEQYRAKNIREAVQKVLITFGGEDRADWTTKSIKWLERFVHRKVQVTVVVGMLNARYEEINKFTDKTVHHEYSVLRQVDEMESYMKECDVAFCGGGTSILELAYLGKPVVALPQHEMERRFLGIFEDQKYILEGAEESILQMTPRPCLNLFEGDNLRANIQRIGNKLVDGRGIYRIAEIIHQETTRRNTSA